MTVRPADQVVSRTTSRKVGPVAGFGNRDGPLPVRLLRARHQTRRRDRLRVIQAHGPHRDGATWVNLAGIGTVNRAGWSWWAGATGCCMPRPRIQKTSSPSAPAGRWRDPAIWSRSRCPWWSWRGTSWAAAGSPAHSTRAISANAYPAPAREPLHRQPSTTSTHPVRRVCGTGGDKPGACGCVPRGSGSN